MICADTIVSIDSIGKESTPVPIARGREHSPHPRPLEIRPNLGITAPRKGADFAMPMAE